MIVCAECGHPPEEHEHQVIADIGLGSGGTVEADLDIETFCKHHFYKKDGVTISCTCENFTIGQATLLGTSLNPAWVTDAEVEADMKTRGYKATVTTPSQW